MPALLAGITNVREVAVGSMMVMGPVEGPLPTLISVTLERFVPVMVIKSPPATPATGGLSDERKGTSVAMWMVGRPAVVAYLLSFGVAFALVVARELPRMARQIREA